MRTFQNIRSDIFNIIEGVSRPEMRPLRRNYYLPLPRWNPSPFEDAFQTLKRAPARLSAGLRDLSPLLKLVTPQQVLRLAMIYAMILGMVSLNRIPLNQQVKTPEFPQEAETVLTYTEEAGDADEGGMGMTYLDAAMPVNFEPAESGGAPFGGIPEPLEYSKPQVLLYTSYKIGPGDTIGRIAGNFGLNQDTIISINTIRNSRSLQIGQILNVPNQDGILYTVKKGDTLDRIAKKYQVEIPVIQTVNELFSNQVNSSSTLFIPGARLDAMDLQEINGDLFVWPLRGYITSLYGYRSNPFTKRRQFHTGIDIAAPMGTPIKSAMGGRVSSVGYNESTGNHVVITHHSGYKTLYGHMSIIRVKSGAYVKAGDRIGDVGSTGLSTGPHLHFTVYKNGVTVNPWGLLN
ncbi:MAG: M23 family metallopeptidase [Treponema sp.]|jgi:murein DD-endopeptidase MepM/ murein hydrolase activator NlpD|nr:M23 family metallopeptidase [Treponema sp.]